MELNTQTIENLRNVLIATFPEDVDDSYEETLFYTLDSLGEQSREDLAHALEKLATEDDEVRNRILEKIGFAWDFGEDEASFLATVAEAARGF